MTRARARGLFIAWMMFNVITLSVLYNHLNLWRLLALLAFNALAAVVAYPLLARIARRER